LRAVLIGVIAVLTSAGANAQDDFHRFTFNVGGGYTGIGGRQSDRVDHGGNVQVGAGFNFNSFLSVNGTFMFHQLGITREALDAASQPDGNVRVYSLTVDPKLSLPKVLGVKPYVLVGGGWIRRTTQFTQPTLANTIIFDPWWGIYRPGVVVVNQVLGTFSTNGGMYNAGLGVDFSLPNTRMKIFAEGRYVHGFTESSNTILAPLTVGLRW
jgi:hypothetical protein